MIIMRHKTHIAAQIEALGHRNACAPIAIAIHSRVPVEAVLEACERAGKLKGSGMYPCQIDVALKILGLEKVSASYKGRTPKTFSSKEDCIVMYSGHMAAYESGKLIDWTNGRRYRIIGCYKLIKGDQT